MKTEYGRVSTRNVLDVYVISSVSSNKRPPPSQRKVMLLEFLWYCKFPKCSDTQKICCNHSKVWTMWFYHRVMSPNDTDGMANSVDSDRSSLIWVCTVCPGISVRKHRIITVYSFWKKKLHDGCFPGCFWDNQLGDAGQHLNYKKITVLSTNSWLICQTGALKLRLHFNGSFLTSFLHH